MENSQNHVRKQEKIVCDQITKFLKTNKLLQTNSMVLEPQCNRNGEETQKGSFRSVFS